MEGELKVGRWEEVRPEDDQEQITENHVELMEEFKLDPPLLPPSHNLVPLLSSHINVFKSSNSKKGEEGSELASNELASL